MSKNLLITFGCSMTEGWGLYLGNVPISPAEPHFDNFHEKGWPNKLAKNLKFDKCLNFGVAGSGISFQSSLFLDVINLLEEEYKNWNIHIILQLSAFCRRSAYRNGKLCQIGKGFRENEWMNLYSEIQLSSDFPITDDLLFQRPYVESFIGVCNSKNIKYTIFSFHDVEIEFFKKIISDTSHFLKSYRLKTEEISIDGGHPNEVGYQSIANYIFEQLPDSWKIGTSEYLEWDYIGNSMKLTYNYDNLH